MYSKQVLIIIFVLYFINGLYPQSAGDYILISSGNWDDEEIWERYNGSAWIVPDSPPNSSANTITISYLHSVELSRAVTVDQMIIESGATLTVSSAGSLSVSNGLGTDLNVNGTIINSGTITVFTGAAVCFNSQSLYVHSRNGGSIPSATWSLSSTCEITGITTTAPTALWNIVQFGNFTWNSQQSQDINLVVYSFTVNGNLTIRSTGGYWLHLMNSSNTVNISGDLILNGGWLSLAQGTAAATLNLSGNFNMSAGQLGTQVTSDYYISTIKFNKSGNQYYSVSGGTISGARINWQILTNARLILCNDFIVDKTYSQRTLDLYGTLVFGNYVVKGQGSFLAHSGCTMEVGSPDGLMAGTVLAGNVQVTGTRDYVATTNYIFNSDAPQVTGNAISSTLSGPYAKNITIDNQGGFALTLNSNITVQENLVLKKGSINPNNYSISYSSTGGRLVYRGSTVQTTTNAEWNALSNPLEIIIDNPEGVILHAGRSYGGILTILQGGLNLNGNVLALNNTGRVSETSGSTVRGSSGSITAYLTLNSPFNSNIGGLGAFITADSKVLGNTTITRGHAAFTATGLYGINRYYNISPANNSGLGATLTLKYDHSELNGMPEENLKLFKSDNSGSTWSIVPAALDMANNTLTAAGISSFSLWTIGDVNPPLPVELTDFRAEINKTSVTLRWNTATETENYGFEIEKMSTLQSDWKRIGFIKGCGNSNVPREYSFTDEGCYAPSIYSYRLKQIDFNGGFEYSRSVQVEIKKPQSYLLQQNFPNPFNPVTTIGYYLPEKGQVKLSVFNILGNKIADLVDEVLNEGYYNVSFDASGFPSSVYIYKLETGKFSEVKKMHFIK